MLIGVLSDAHGHEAAFLRGLNLLNSEGVDRIFFLGDAVGYISSLGVVNELRKREIPCILGNHEAMLISGRIDPEKDEVYQFESILGHITLDELSYISSWPEARWITDCDKKIMLIHGSPLDPVFGYVYPDTDLTAFSDTVADVIFMGNTHHPFVRQEDGKLFVNVGSCGLPRDAVAKGCVCIYDSDNNHTDLIRYDISESCRELVKNTEIHDSVRNLLNSAAQAGL